MLCMAWDQLQVAPEGLEKLRTSVLVAVGLSALGFIVLLWRWLLPSPLDLPARLQASPSSSWGAFS